MQGTERLCERCETNMRENQESAQARTPPRPGPSKPKPDKKRERPWRQAPTRPHASMPPAQAQALTRASHMSHAGKRASKHAGQARPREARQGGKARQARGQVRKHTSTRGHKQASEHASQRESQQASEQESERASERAKHQASERASESPVRQHVAPPCASTQARTQTCMCKCERCEHHTKAQEVKPDKRFEHPNGQSTHGKSRKLASNRARKCSSAQHMVATRLRACLLACSRNGLRSLLACLLASWPACVRRVHAGM